MHSDLLMHYAGFKVCVHRGLTIKPKWYDFPRRWGWRPMKHMNVLKDGACILDEVNNTIYCTPAFEAQLRETLDNGGISEFNLRNPF